MRPNFLNVLRNFFMYRAEQWKDADSIRRIQQQRLRDITMRAADVPFYKNLMAENSLSAEDVCDDLQSLPVVSKDDFQDSPDSFLHPAQDRSMLTGTRTSGSTGRPFSLFMDRNALEHRSALLALAETEFGLSPFDLFAEISHVDYTSFPFLPSLGLFRKMHLSVFDDDEKNLSALRKARADIAGWYPSVISILAKLNNESGKPMRLKSVFCGGELLRESQRKIIKDSFSCPVFSQYGCEEFSTIAWECPEEHSLHVNAGSSFVEIVDDKGKPKKSGTGEIVVTGLYNKAMPLIRYNVGDRASWGTCSCGRGLPVLKSVEGRADDFIVLPSGKLRSSFSLEVDDLAQGMRAYQIVQEKEDLFVFRYVSAFDPPVSLKKKIKERIEKGCCGEEIKVEFQHADEIKKGRTGKLRSIISKVRK